MTTADLIHARAESARLDASRVELDSDHAFASGRIQLARRLSATARSIRATADGWELSPAAQNFQPDRRI